MITGIVDTDLLIVIRSARQLNLFKVIGPLTSQYRGQWQYTVKPLS